MFQSIFAKVFSIILFHFCFLKTFVKKSTENIIRLITNYCIKYLCCFGHIFDRLRGLECKKRSTRKTLLSRGLFEGKNALFSLKNASNSSGNVRKLKILQFLLFLQFMNNFRQSSWVRVLKTFNEEREIQPCSTHI